MSPAAVTPPARFLRLLDAAPLRWKIASIGAVGALGMVVLTRVTVGEVASVRTAADRAVQAEQVRGQAALLDEIVTQARVAQRSFITDVHMHGASAASDEAPRRAAYLALVHRADAVVQAFPRSDQGDTAALLGDIAEQATAVAAFDTAATKAYRSGSADGLSAGDDQARQAVAAFATMRDRITLVVEQAQAASAQADADENAAIRRLFITLISCLVLACLVMVAATTYVSRRIRSAVDAVRASMNAIRSRDLTVHCEATSHDELGVLSADTEATRAELSWLIGEVNAAAHAVAQTSEQVLTQSRSVEEDSRAGASSA